MNAQNKKLIAALKHLDAQSKEAFRSAGRLLKSGTKPRVRFVYNPKTSKRIKRKVLPFVGNNEIVGVMFNAKFNKQGGITLLVADHAREEVGKPGKPVMTHMTLDRVSNVVHLGLREDEPK